MMSQRIKPAILPVGVALLDLCWLYPWVLLLSLAVDGSRPLIPSIMVLALLVSGRVSARSQLSRARPLRWVRLVLVLGGLIAALAALAVSFADRWWLAVEAAPWTGLVESVLQPAPIACFLVAILVWWRGILWGRGEIDFDDVASVFKLGFVSFVTFLVLLSFLDSVVRDSLQQASATYVIMFLLSGLCALAISRLEAVRSRPGLNTVSFDATSLLVLLTSLASLAALTLLVAQLMSFEVLDALFSPILSLLGVVLAALVYALAIPIGLLLEALVFAVRLVFHPASVQQPFQMPNASFLDRGAHAGSSYVFPPELALALKLISIAVTVFVLGRFTVRSIYRWQKTQEQDLEIMEERDSLFTWPSPRALLAALWRTVRRKFLEKAAPGIPAGKAEVVSDSLPPIKNIRLLYRRVLALGAGAGSPRAAFTTPHEHLPKLSACLGQTNELESITESYVAARYGDRDLSDEELVAARVALLRLSQGLEGAEVRVCDD